MNPQPLLDIIDKYNVSGTLLFPELQMLPCIVWTLNLMAWAQPNVHANAGMVAGTLFCHCARAGELCVTGRDACM